MKIRFCQEAEAYMRVKHREKLFDSFYAVDPDGRKREMFLMCSEVIILDKICKVYRMTDDMDAMNRPLHEPQLIYKYPCTFVRKTDSLKQREPNAVFTSEYMLYGESVMDIKPGDLIEVDGLSFWAAMPFRPENHHTEVEITLKGDA